jgi:hypothetical protein
MKSYFVDTAATIIFFTVVAGLSELLIAGMGPTQFLIARLIMIPVMMVTARPYGLWRDCFFQRPGPNGGSRTSLVTSLLSLHSKYLSMW